ncbi:uncharacterized protein LOC135708709 [Ochlerotatus camptorhynchus]|uniref:uncharacterized protein LOC135708709 n=1 Tax=Ochlerotatus camptorhynchus TaxID=644619 RepID=UPI0031E1D632
MHQGNQPQMQQQQMSIQADPMMLQILHQLQQQQVSINQLLVQQQETAQRQQQAFLKQHEQVIRSTMSAFGQPPTHPEQIVDSLANNIVEFRYEPDSGVTFAAWYTRYDNLFSKDAVRLDDEVKVRLLLRKLEPSEHERYVSYILPKTTKEVNFTDTLAKLKSLFGTVESLISRRYRCLQVVKQPGEDYKTYACRLNRLCVEFELAKMSEEQFKCLLFVCGLKSEGDGEIRTRLLTRIEENAAVTGTNLRRMSTTAHDQA